MNIAYVALYILNQKNVAKTKYIPFCYLSFQNGFFKVAEATCISLWNKLLIMDPELASATLDLKYISTQESSIIKMH